MMDVKTYKKITILYENVYDIKSEDPKYDLTNIIIESDSESDSDYEDFLDFESDSDPYSEFNFESSDFESDYEFDDSDFYDDTDN